MHYICKKKKKKQKNIYLKIWLTKLFLKYTKEYYIKRENNLSAYQYSYNKINIFLNKMYVYIKKI